MSEHDLATLIARLEKALGISWQDVTAWLQRQNTLSELEQRLSSGDMFNVIQGVEDAAARYAADLQAAYVASGQHAARWLDENVQDKIIRFDQANREAIRYAEANRLELVTGMTQEARATASQIIADGVRVGANPRETAKLLRDTVGLTSSQADAVTSYRRALESGDYANALARELSDGRSDRSVQAALSGRRALSAEQVDQAVARYAGNMTAFRAEAIARTESQRAAHGGSDEMFRQAIDNGDVEASELVHEWLHAGHGPHSRPGHVEMNGQQRKRGELFDNPITGAQLCWPCDPRAPASETIMCRCTVTTRMVG